LKNNQPPTKRAPFLSNIPPSIARIITAVVLLPVLIASILIDQLAILFCLLAAAAIVLGEIEFWVLARKKQVRADVTAQVLSGFALLVIFYFTAPGRRDNYRPALTKPAERSAVRGELVKRPDAAAVGRYPGPCP